MLQALLTSSDAMSAFCINIHHYHGHHHQLISTVTNQVSVKVEDDLLNSVTTDRTCAVATAPQILGTVTAHALVHTAAAQRHKVMPPANTLVSQSMLLCSTAKQSNILQMTAA